MNLITRFSLFISLLVCCNSARLAAESSPSPVPAANQGYAYQPKDVGKAAKPLKILILGGTGFTGPYQVKYALARGHTVTVFNRGKSHPGGLPSGVEQLIGDRTGQL